MTFDEKYNYIADRCDALVGRSIHANQWKEWTTHGRTLYFAHDVYGITINAGLPAWISYHGQSFEHEDVHEAVAAFRRLHLDRAADAIEACLKVYQEHGNGFPDGFEGYEFSDEIWDHGEEIYDALCAYLQDAPKPAGEHDDDT